MNWKDWLTETKRQAWVEDDIMQAFINFMEESRGLTEDYIGEDIWNGLLDGFIAGVKWFKSVHSEKSE